MYEGVRRAPARAKGRRTGRWVDVPKWAKTKAVVVFAAAPELGARRLHSPRNIRGCGATNSSAPSIAPHPVFFPEIRRLKRLKWFGGPPKSTGGAGPAHEGHHLAPRSVDIIRPGQLSLPWRASWIGRRAVAQPRAITAAAHGIHWRLLNGVAHAQHVA